MDVYYFLSPSWHYNFTLIYLKMICYLNLSNSLFTSALNCCQEYNWELNLFVVVFPLFLTVTAFRNCHFSVNVFSKDSCLVVKSLENRQLQFPLPNYYKYAPSVHNIKDYVFTQWQCTLMLYAKSNCSMLTGSNCSHRKCTKFLLCG